MACYTAALLSVYRGWGPFLGAPAEIGAFAVALATLLNRRFSVQTRRLALVAPLAYALMIATFFLFNNPVNNALKGWTVMTLPPNWQSYRLQWEVAMVWRPHFPSLARSPSAVVS